MSGYPFETKSLPAEHDITAPDGSAIRVLARLGRGSMAHGTLPSGHTSLAIRHRTVDEIWYVLSGRAEIWRAVDDSEQVVAVAAGDSLTIPAGTRFQFRALGDESFEFLMCTIPPWTDASEAVYTDGIWTGTPA